MPLPNFINIIYQKYLSMLYQKNFYYLYYYLLTDYMQEYIPPANQLKIKTNIFELSITKTENKLSFLLGDYTDWGIYQKEYLKENLKDNKEIHPKVDFQDLYYSLSEGVEITETPGSGSENRQEQDLQKIFQYKFDEHRVKNGTLLYKVQQNGIIVVYHCIEDKIKKKQVVFESRLQLVKQREMTDIQRLQKKFSIQKWYLLKQRKQLKNTIVGLQNENNKLKQKQNEQRINYNGQNIVYGNQKNDLSSILYEKDNQIKLLTRQNQELLKRFQGKQLADRKSINNQQKQKQKQIQIENTSAQINQKIQQIEPESIQEQNNRLKQENQILKKALQQRQINKQFYKNQMQKQIIQKWNQKQRLSKLLSGFKVMTNFYKGYQNFILPLPYQNQFTFTVKIVKIPNINKPYIGIGLFDINQQVRPNTLYNSGFAVGYYCWDRGSGKFYPGQLTQGTGFNQGSIINVSVNLKKGQITFKDQQNILARMSLPILQQGARNFVPYIETYYKDTSIQWVI